MTKTEARAWLKRIREDVRMIEQAIRVDDGRAGHDLALDVSGAADKLAEHFAARVEWWEPR